MRFRQLLHLRRDRTGEMVPMDVLCSLRLPMPEDVLEQVLHDHGIKPEFQKQYGHLDLTQLSWHQEELRADTLVPSSVYIRYSGYVDDIADRLRRVARHGWSDVHLPHGAAEHWQRSKTWMRAPVFLNGSLIGSDRSLHLVEGHTRLGALRGLLETGLIRPDSTHTSWVGRSCEGRPDDTWVRVMQDQPLSFLRWLYDQMARGDDVGLAAMKLVDSRLDEEDFAAVMQHVQSNRALSRFVGTITKAHREWRDWQVQGLEIGSGSPAPSTPNPR
jgi:hypothetical protein